MSQNVLGSQSKKFRLFLAYCKVGLIGFGGGSALIPVIEKETVNDLKAISEEDYTKHTIIANITPGTLPTKLGALSTPDTSVACAYGGTLPGVLLTVFLLSIISFLGGNTLNYISYASIGIIVFIVYLLAEYIHRVISGGKTVQERRFFTLIALFSFLIIGGKEIRSLLGTLFGIENVDFLSPILDIATIDLMIVTFFIICFLGQSRNYIRIVTAALMSILYFAAVSKSNILELPVPYLQIGMLLLTVGSIIYDCQETFSAKSFIRKKSKPRLSKETRKIILSILMFFILMTVLYAIAALLEGTLVNSGSLSVTDFSLKCIIATCTSFGGGEAFISIADGTFIESNYMSAGNFYSQVVPVANALPGPILVKILAGIGYSYGAGHYTSPAFGWLLSMLGTAIGVGCSSILALIVMLGFDSMKDSIRLNMIKKYILPVVCGMLIATSVSMFREVLVVFREHLEGKGIGYGLVISITLYLLIIYGVKKLKLPDVAVLICAAIISLVAMVILV
jgi:chromate transporter